MVACSADMMGEVWISLSGDLFRFERSEGLSCTDDFEEDRGLASGASFFGVEKIRRRSIYTTS